MKKLFIALILFYLLPSTQAQKLPNKIPTTREIVLNAADTIQKIRIFIANPKVKIEENKFYTWYQKQLILHTQGAWSGKLLQGKYESFYPNHNLLEQGIYEKGWKVGLWKRWYADGTLKEQVSWKKGVRHGSFETFDANGQLTQKGRYKNGQLHGPFSTFVDGKETKVKYRKDKIVVKKEASNKFQLFKKKKQPNDQAKQSPKKSSKSAKPAQKKETRPTKKHNHKQQKKKQSSAKKDLPNNPK